MTIYTYLDSRNIWKDSRNQLMSIPLQRDFLLMNFAKLLKLQYEAYEKEDVMDKKTSFPSTDLKRRNYNNKGK